MARTKIDVQGVINANSQINSAKRTVNQIRGDFDWTRGQISSSILNRNNLRQRMWNVSNNLASVESRLNRIKSTVENSANTYKNTDRSIVTWRALTDGKIGKKMVAGLGIDSSKKPDSESLKEKIVQLFKGLTGRAKPTNGVINGFALNILMNNFSNEKTINTLTSDDIKEGLSFVSKINKGIGKYGKNSKASLSSSILSYLSTLVDITNSKSSSGLDTTSDMLSLFKSSVKVEDGIYKYYEKTLHPYEASKLDSKFGKTMIGLNIASDVAGIADSAIDTYKVFVDPESSVYDKASEVIKTGKPFLDLGKDVYIASQAGTKTLQFVSSASRTGKTVNQILATEQKLMFTTPSTVTQKIKNVGAGFTIAGSTVSGLASAVKQYGEVTEDGKFDMGDAGSVGMNFSLSALDSMASSVTFGLVDFDSEKVADDLETDIAEFARGDSWAANVIRDEEVWAPARFVVSVGAGAYVLGENIGEGIVNGAKAVGSWVSTGWNTVTNWF